jgi:hypothetical protein
MLAVMSPTAAAKPPLPTAAQAFLLCLLLAACGGGGGETEGLPPVVDAGPTLHLASGPSLVAPGCDGGRAGGSVYVDAEVEPWVVASAVDPALLVGVWQQDRASDGGARALVSARSNDGGRSWQRTLQPLSRCGGAEPGSPGDHQRASDPWVDIGPDGSVHLMGLAFDGANLTPGSSSAMLVRRSTDGGRSWGPVTTLQRDGDELFNDKNTLTADPTDARLVYAVWDRLDRLGNGPTLLARSTDGGLSWEPAREIHVPRVSGGVSQTIGNRIVVLTDGPERGLLVNAFVQIDTVAGLSTASVRVQRSLDQGRSWSEPITVAEHRAVGTRDPASGEPVRDGALLPSVAAGPGGRLWLAWQDARFSNGARDAIALSQSSDGGRRWSAPLAVNRDAAVAAFTPTLQVLADGRVGLMHFDLRSAGSGTLRADLWLLSSADGVAWTETALARGIDLARAPAVAGGRFLGDYHGLASAQGDFVPLVALPGPGDANRTEVYSARLSGTAGTRHVARAARADALGAGDPTRLTRARSQAIGAWMEARLPGWQRRVQQRQP